MANLDEVTVTRRDPHVLSGHLLSRGAFGLLITTIAASACVNSGTVLSPTASSIRSPATPSDVPSTANAPVAPSPSAGPTPTAYALFVLLDLNPLGGLRSGPGCQFGEVLRPQSSDYYTHLPIIGQSGDWWLVDLGEPQTGWVFSPFHSWNSAVFGPISQVLSYPTPTPVPTQPPLAPDIESLEEAQQVLVRFFQSLSDGRYDEAVEYYGAGYASFWSYGFSDYVDNQQDYPAILENACRSMWWCLPVRRVVSARQLSPIEFEFTVEFVGDNGEAFTYGFGPVPGSEFNYTVVRDCQGRYYVVDWPLSTG